MITVSSLIKNDKFPQMHFIDEPQCPDPTPVRGTMKILHGHPFSYGCNVLLVCDPGLVFEDGKSVWNLTCLGLSVLPPQCIWVPVHDGRPVCKGIIYTVAKLHVFTSACFGQVKCVC